MKEIQLTDSAAPLTSTLLLKHGWKCAYLSLSDTADPLSVQLQIIRLTKSEIEDVLNKINSFFLSSFFNIDELKDDIYVPSDFEYSRSGDLLFKVLSPEEFMFESKVFESSELNTRIVLTRNELYNLKLALEGWLSENND